jgi:hypothetical protein
VAPRRIRYEIEPMTLGNMRELGVRSLDVSCWLCHHQAVLNADRWPDDLPVPAVARTPRASSCAFSDRAAAPAA